MEYEATDFVTSPHARHVQLSTSTPLQPFTSAPQATFQVTTLADVIDASDGVLSLREAIDQANATPGADTITFAESIRGGTIELTSELPTITDDVTIDGDPSNGGAGSITVDGAIVLNSNFNFVSGAYTVLQATGAAVGLEDLTITGGETGIEAEGSDLQLARVAVDNNTQAGVLGGAGIGIDLTDASLVLTDSSVSGNVGEGGAGILFTNSNLIIQNSHPAMTTR
jgi:CSLREA domain-containing protein